MDSLTNSIDYSGVIPAERHKLVVEYIELNKSAQIRELSVRFGVSEATIRRDLDELSKMGRITRTHGGAIQIESSTSYETVHSEKMKLMLEEKSRIAAAAASLVKNGDTVLLDSGTTTFLLAEYLEQVEDLTVITYDLHIADTVSLHPTSNMILTGGTRRGNDYHVLTGNMVDGFISSINVNIFFLAADAISELAGVSNANLDEAHTKKLALRAGRKKVLVADSTKFGRTALAHVCNIDQLDTLITDSGIGAEERAWLQTSGVTLMEV